MKERVEGIERREDQQLLQVEPAVDERDEVPLLRAQVEAVEVRQELGAEARHGLHPPRIADELAHDGVAHDFDVAAQRQIVGVGIARLDELQVGVPGAVLPERIGHEAAPLRAGGSNGERGHVSLDCIRASLAPLAGRGCREAAGEGRMLPGWRPSSRACGATFSPHAGRRLYAMHVARTRLLILAVALVLGIPAGFISAHVIRVPQVRSLEDYQPAIITRVYDRNGVPFAEYAIQKRIVVAKKDISPWLYKGILATEDADFNQHGGINPKALVRAAIKDIIARRKVEGASTLTQQLAKQVFLTPEKSFRRKINEAFLAVEIEKNFTKDQIFELYANQVYLGHGAYGVEQASRLYFGKHAKDLTIPEAAVIAGLIRSPMPYSPITHPDKAVARRNHVLYRMLEERFIDRRQYQQALNAPLVLGTYKEEAPRVGAYFAEEIRQYIEHNEKFGLENLYQRGLKVYSTLDFRIQQAAEVSLQRGLRAWDRRRGFRTHARNLMSEGIDPAAYKDASWSNDALVPDKLYTAVVMDVDKGGVAARVNREQIALPPAAFKWTQKTTMEGVLRRGDIIYVRIDEDPKTHARTWKLDQLPQVQGAVVIMDVKTGEVRALVGGYDFQISKFNRAIQSRRQVGSSVQAL